MSISMKELINSNMISSNSIKLIPNKCRCGAELVFNDSLRVLKCSNKNCKYTMIAKISNINKKLNLGLSDADIENIVDTVDIQTPYQILIIDDILNNGINIELHDKKSFLQSIEKVKRKEFELYKVVELCGIESIEKVAFKLFDGFNSMDDAFEQIDIGQLSFLNERLGIKNSDSAIISFCIYSDLTSIKDELLFAESIFNIKKYADVLNIAFADNIIPFFNISDVLEHFNAKYKYHFNLVTVVNDKCDILIRNSESSSTKIKAATAVNSKSTTNAMNRDKVKFSDIGKFNAYDLKPIGHSIYIDTLENVIERLDTLKGAD